MSTGPELLKLVARDAADLGVISSMLQDALVPTSDMVWLQDEKRFVIAVNRFRWEYREAAERIHAGVSFENVERVQRRNIVAGRRAGFLDLLSITIVDTPQIVATVVELTFAGNAAIRLETASLLCHLEDFGEPWPSQWRPDHADS